MDWTSPGPASWKHLYMKGDVDDDQSAFLAEQVATGKGLILLTHHQGLDDTAPARRTTRCYSKIVACVEAHRLGDGPWYWYWGHIHAGYVHTDDVAPFRGRCAGHGGIPVGAGPGLGAIGGHPVALNRRPARSARIGSRTALRS